MGRDHVQLYDLNDITTKGRTGHSALTRHKRGEVLPVDEPLGAYFDGPQVSARIACRVTFLTFAASGTVRYSFSSAMITSAPSVP